MFWPASEWRRAVDAENCCVINVFHAKLKVVALDIRQWDKINRDHPLNWYLSSRPCDVMEIKQTLTVAKRTQTIDCQTQIISLIAIFHLNKIQIWPLGGATCITYKMLFDMCCFLCLCFRVCNTVYSVVLVVQLFLCNCLKTIVAVQCALCSGQCSFIGVWRPAYICTGHLRIYKYCNIFLELQLHCLFDWCYCLFVAWVALNCIDHVVAILSEYCGPEAWAEGKWVSTCA